MQLFPIFSAFYCASQLHQELPYNGSDFFLRDYLLCQERLSSAGKEPFLTGSSLLLQSQPPWAVSPRRSCMRRHPQCMGTSPRFVRPTVSTSMGNVSSPPRRLSTD